MFAFSIDKETRQVLWLTWISAWSQSTSTFTLACWWSQSTEFLLLILEIQVAFTLFLFASLWMFLPSFQKFFSSTLCRRLFQVPVDFREIWGSFDYSTSNLLHWRDLRKPWGLIRWEHICGCQKHSKVGWDSMFGMIFHPTCFNDFQWPPPSSLIRWILINQKIIFQAFAELDYPPEV